MNKYAPVLITTLNRFDHFQRSVDSLAMCREAVETDLYIALDYPSKENHWEGYKLTENYLRNINGFKSINIIKRKENFGALRNFFDSQAIVFNNYDSLIHAEDDVVFAPSFLTFINKGLEIYKNRSDIFSVSGYNYPFEMPTWYHYDAYFIQAFTAWGVGIWKEKWNKLDWSMDNFIDMLNKKENYQILKKHYQRYLPQLLKIRDTGIITCDGFIFLYLLDKKLYSIYPIKTRTGNIGHDGSGEHCSYDEIYLKQKLYDGMEEDCFPIDMQPNKKLTDHILKHVQIPFILRIRQSIPSLLKKTLKKIIKK